MTYVLLIVVPPFAAAAFVVGCDLVDDWLSRRRDGSESHGWWCVRMGVVTLLAGFALLWMVGAA